MKNLIVGLFALPILALVIWLGYLLICFVISSAAIIVGLLLTFGPPILAGLLALGLVVGVIYILGSIVRNSLRRKL